MSGLLDPDAGESPTALRRAMPSASGDGVSPVEPPPSPPRQSGVTLGSPYHRSVARAVRRSALARRGVRYVTRSLERAAGWRAVGVAPERLVELIVRQSAQPFPVQEVLRVLDALRESGLSCWLGGGWGVDALLGTQSRIHFDLDLVVDDLDANRPALRRALSHLGYQPRQPRETGAWWVPYSADFEGPSGLKIEALGVDWDVLAAARSLMGCTGTNDPSDLDIRAACFTFGTFCGVEVPCLSGPAQILFHTGYADRTSDRRDMALVRAISQGERPGTSHEGEKDDTRLTSLVVPVLAFDGMLHRIWSEHHPAGSVPYLTLFYPFLVVADVEGSAIGDLAGIFKAEPRFEFELGSVGWFDKHVTFLSPQPAEQLVRMTKRVSEAFPLQPYGGEFSDIVPHLTLGEDLPLPALRRLATRAGAPSPGALHRRTDLARRPRK